MNEASVEPVQRILNDIDSQAFLQSYDSAPRPPIPPLSRQKGRGATHRKTENVRQLAQGGGSGERGGRGAKSYGRKKAGSSINNSILSELIRTTE